MSVRIPEDLVPLLVPIDDVTQHPDNPNNGDVEAIAESILTHGFINPVLVQESTGHILAGNHRYAAMLSLGETEIPAVTIACDDEQALRILIVDNRTAELAVRDSHALAALLKTLAASDDGLAGTAFTADDYLELRRLNHISEGSHFHLDQALEYDSGVTPFVIVSGMLDDDGRGVTFDADEADHQVVQLREMGFNARRGDHLG